MAEVTQQIILEYIGKADKLQASIDSAAQSNKKLEESAKDASKVVNEELGEKGKTKMQSLKETITQVGVTIALAFSAKKITDFLISSVKLAEQAQEIKIAFAKLNDPNLLAKLREAVAGTVSDVNLMKTAIQAKNFHIPLNDLAEAFEFAKLKADETGKSTEELANTIIDSIGRNSPRALVQLGISQESINAKVKETGSLYKGLTGIIHDTLQTAGEDTDTAADKTERLNAQYENLKVEIGEKLLPLANSFLGVLNNWVGSLQTALKSIHQIKEEVAAASNAQFNQNEVDMFLQFLDDSADKFDTLSAAASAYNNFAINEVIKRENEAVTVGEKLALAGDKVYQSYKRQIAAVTAYVIEQQKANEKNTDTDEKVTDTGEAFKYTGEQIEKYVASLNKLPKDFSNQVQVFTAEEIALRALGEAWLFYNGQIERAVERNGNPVTPVLPPQRDLAAGAIDKQKADLEDFADFSNSIQDSISSYTQSQTEYRISLLQKQNEDGLLSDKAYETAKKKLLEKQAERDRRNAIFQAVIQAAVNIEKAIGTLNPVLVTLTTIASFAQIASIIATPVPKFAKGTDRVLGGRKGKDSVPALLMPDEAVITAHQNMKAPGLAKAWNQGKLDDYILRVYAPKLMAKAMNNNTVLDDSGIVRGLHELIITENANNRKLIKALQNNYNPDRNWN